MSSEAIETVEGEVKEEGSPAEPPKEVPEGAEQPEKKEGEEAAAAAEGAEGAAPEGAEGEVPGEGAGGEGGEEGAEGEGAPAEGEGEEGGVTLTPSGAVVEGVPGEEVSVAGEVEKEESISSSVKYGGCEGQNAMYLRLQSSDKHEFIVRRDYALISSTIKAILGRPQESEEVADTVQFRTITSHIMCIVCEYFNYRAYYSKTAPPFPPFEVPPELAMTLLMTANMLQI